MNVGVKRAWVFDEEAKTLQQEIEKLRELMGQQLREQGEHSEELIRVN